MPSSPPFKRKGSFSLSPSLWWRLSGAATKEGLTPNQIIMLLVNGYLRGMIDLPAIEAACTKEGWFKRRG